MRKLFLFMMISVDGYFEGENHDISWHNVDAEFNEYAIDQTKNVGTLLFGRRTYELMKGYWPTERARTDDPVVAELMNTTSKIVFSRSLDKTEQTEHWQNVKLMKEAEPEQIKRIKTEAKKDLAIYGSNNLAVSLLEMGLVDELRIMVNPIALGQGHAVFSGLRQKLKLNLINSRTFKSGNILLCYAPAKKPAQ